MSDVGHHGEWLSLLDVSGPFLAEPVLKEALPQGLEGLDPIVKKEVRQAYDEWREALDFEEKDFPKLHGAWISFVLNRVLEYCADFLLTGERIAGKYRHIVPENGIALFPDAVLTDGKEGGRAFLLVKKYETQGVLNEAASLDGWATSPIERMIELCRTTGVRLGLVTNGEQWTLVDAPVGAVTSTASWYARLWSQEPITLRAFANLLGLRRFFGGTEGELTHLLDKSLTLQDEVTDALGEQVRRAVEVLVQSLDRADQDRNRELLKDVSPEELYEAGLTIMMRIVFLLSAEERGLLLLGDRQYEANYAVSTLRGQLRLEAEEVLERRWDAWSRLLSLFRGVFAGVDHEAMRMPALGGSLFDPDRFPFLEGRSKGSNWKTDPAIPLPIDNRTVLLLLDAVQLFQGRTLSYLALDVEQIGYVYEGLLERTVVRAGEATLDLTATKSAKAPWVALSELDDAAADGRSAVEELLKEKTGSSLSRIRNDLAKKPDEIESGKLLAACDGDINLRDRIKPYFHLLRTDSWGYPLVYPKGTFMVATGTDRRETGTHYTPTSLTKTVVIETLEPCVYLGPREGRPRLDWKLKSSTALLELKICDPATGSGAFLVQVCRWLSDRILEAWDIEEKSGLTIDSTGTVALDGMLAESIPKEVEERRLLARRLVVERCIYGVDKNRLAVELAKVSLWLVTLAKGRPFGFLDHNLRCGDSLLGITRLEQILFFDIEITARSAKKLFAAEVDEAVANAVRLRTQLRRRPIIDIRDIEVMENLERETRGILQTPAAIADALLAEYLDTSSSQPDFTGLSIVAGDAMAGNEDRLISLKKKAVAKLNADVPEGKELRKPFHWPLEFPEVFSEGRIGFDAIVGNPPFRAARHLSSDFGASYLAHLRKFPYSLSGQADLCAAFCWRGYSLLNDLGSAGFIATNTISQGDTRDSFLRPLLAAKGKIVFAISEIWWPGKAQVVVSLFVVSKSASAQICVLDNVVVPGIDATFSISDDVSKEPVALEASKALISKGIGLGSEIFRLSHGEGAALAALDPVHIRRFISGKIHNSAPDLWGGEYVFWFEDIESEAELLELPVGFSFRDRVVAVSRSGRYWRYRRGGAKLQKNIEGRAFRLVRSQTSSTWCFSFMPSSDVFDQSIIIITSNCAGLYGVLSSSFHESWVNKYSTSTKTDTAYSPSECFHNFPLPYDPLIERHPELARLSMAAFNRRVDFMGLRSIGNTAVFNLINSRDNNESAILEFRDDLVRIDVFVAGSYGWNDIALDHDFHGVGENQRFGIGDITRREIVRRLLDLNIQRSEDQVTPTKKYGLVKKRVSSSSSLFD